MSDYGTLPGPGAIRFERLLPGPIERVWAYLTESDKRARWLASGPMDLRAGGRLELRFRNSELTLPGEVTPERWKPHENDSFGGEITRCEPPHLLAFSWNGEPGEASEVTFELTPRGAEVLLTLTHQRLATRGSMLNVGAGWHTHLGVLERELRGEPRQPYWSTMEKLSADYDRAIPAD